MPFADQPWTRFGDGTGPTDSTQVATVELTATGGAKVTPTLGLGSDVLEFPSAANLAAQLTALDAYVTADAGARLDIEDSSNTQLDPIAVEYNRAAPDAATPLDANVVLASSTSKVHTYKVATYQALRQALALLGL